MRETATRESRLARLKHVVQHASLENPFYRAKWQDYGIWPVALQRLADLQALPFTTRAELLRDQLEFPPLGRNISVDPTALRRIYRSSGTSGSPIFWADTETTWHWVLHCSRELFRVAGVQPGDRLLFLLPFGASSGSWLVFEGAASLGCAALAISPADLPASSDFVRSFQPHALVGRPSRLLEFATQFDPAALNPKMLICTSEPCTPRLRDELTRRWRAPALSRYGMTEAGSIASECEHSSGMLHLLENEFIAELISPNDAPAEGDEGELVLTTLDRIHRPIIRYRTGDYVRLVPQHSCRCGRCGAMISGPIRRINPPAAENLELQLPFLAGL